MSQATDMKPFMDAVRAAFKEAGKIPTQDELIHHTLVVYVGLVAAHIKANPQAGSPPFIIDWPKGKD